MRFFRNTLTCGLMSLSLFSVPALASESIGFEPNIYSGNVIASGGFSYSSFGLQDESLSVLNTSVGLQYFILDGLALGANFNLSSISAQESSFKATTIGPVATFYFWNSERLATKVAASMGYTTLGDSNDFSTAFGYSDGITYRFSLGADYFLTESVGLGPSVQYSLLTGGPSTARELAALLGFSILL